MKRVLHVIQSLDTGGAERVVAEYALAHDRTKYAPEVCCVFEGGHLVKTLEEAGIPVHVLRRRWKIDPGALLRLVLLIARRRFDVVHNHNFSALAIGVPAAILSGAATLIRTEHNVVQRRPTFRRLLSRAAALREDAQIAVSAAVRESHIGKERIPARRFATVRNGISGVRLGASEERDGVRSELGLADDAFMCLSVGSLTRQKDFTNLLEAAASLTGDVPNVRFVVVGDGPQRELLRSRCSELGLDEHVLFLGRRTDVPRLLGASDIFVLSSAWEGLPITVLEAMAAGVPCVSTRAGGVGEALVDGVSGLLVRAGDSEALAEAVAKLASDPGLRTRLAANARDTHQRCFTAKSMARQTEALYDLAAGGRADLAASGPIKVLYVIGQLTLGGAERQVAELATRLPRSRYEPVVCCLTNGGPLADEIESAGVRVVSVGKRRGVASGASRTLLDLVRAERPAIMHSYLFSANWRTVLVGRLARVPLVITSVRNVDIHGVFAFTLVERVLSGLNDRVIANAQAVKDYVARTHWIPPEKISVILNGVASERLSSAAHSDGTGSGRAVPEGPVGPQERPAGVRSSPEDGRAAPERRPTVLIVASLTPKKDHSTFLSAAASVNRLAPEARFIVVGDGPLRGELGRLTEELGIASSVEFRGETSDIASTLDEADVCVLTSLKEGCSNFILESMLAGKPVVATDAGGNRELIESGVTGYIVPIGDVRGVASRIAGLLSNPTLRLSMGAKGRERATTEFSIERMVERTVSLYEDTLRERVSGLVDWAYARASRSVVVGGGRRNV